VTRSWRIAVVPGDGIGPEVVREGLRVLERIAKLEGLDIELTRYPFGGDHYRATSEILPDAAFEEIRGHDAVLLGAIGDPRVAPGLLEFGIVGRLRFGLDLFANVRPVRLYDASLTPLKNKGPEHLDFVVVRENTEDAYAGMWGQFKKGTPDEIATQEIIFTRKGVERVLRFAFELCRARNRGRKLTLLTKANAIRAMELWTRAFAEIGAEYPDVKREHQYLDAACMFVVTLPEQYVTVVTSNLFGDIFTDLCAALVGGLGIAASANLHPGRTSLFESIHGSAPQFAGQNRANPLATIMAVSMMLEFLGEKAAATRVEDAVVRVLRSGKLPNLGMDSGVGTDAVGDMVLAELG
jgi:3-isopropylmalate dehydrogenase